jgi:hypothetical protein
MFNNNHDLPLNVYEIAEVFEATGKPSVNYVIAPSQEAAEHFWFEFCKSDGRVAKATLVSKLVDYCYIALPYYDGSVNHEQRE